MTLRLIREPSKDGATLGVLFVNGTFECFILEDVVRQVPGQPVDTWKVPGDTAIPSGLYRVQMTMSRRFERMLPVLCDVPGFSAIRIHAGNRSGDTEGCLIAGRTRATGMVMESRIAVDRLVAQIESATDPVWIEIENPRGAAAGA